MPSSKKIFKKEDANEVTCLILRGREFNCLEAPTAKVQSLLVNSHAFGTASRAASADLREWPRLHKESIIQQYNLEQSHLML